MYQQREIQVVDHPSLPPSIPPSLPPSLPPGKEIHYAWLNDAKNFWPVPPEKRGLTVEDISACINREIQVDQGLGMAVKMGHEVMFKTGERGFVVIPVAYEREIRARLGLGYE